MATRPVRRLASTASVAALVALAPVAGCTGTDDAARPGPSFVLPDPTTTAPTTAVGTTVPLSPPPPADLCERVARLDFSPLGFNPLPPTPTAYPDVIGCEVRAFRDPEQNVRVGVLATPAVSSREVFDRYVRTVAGDRPLAPVAGLGRAASTRIDLVPVRQASLSIWIGSYALELYARPVDPTAEPTLVETAHLVELGRQLVPILDLPADRLPPVPTTTIVPPTTTLAPSTTLAPGATTTLPPTTAPRTIVAVTAASGAAVNPNSASGR